MGTKTRSAGRVRPTVLWCPSGAGQGPRAGRRRNREKGVPREHHREGPHTEVNDRFRRHVDNKLAKIERLNQKVIRVDVEVSEERNPRLADQRERVELTIRPAAR